MLKIGIIGATGYAGEELIRVLLGHPKVEITSLSAKIDQNQPIQDIFPQFRDFIDLECEVFESVEKIAEKADLFFLALPHTVSLDIVPQLLKKGKKVIDLSADYRFDSQELYEKWYEVKHTHSALLEEKVYGLPELYREKIKTASLVANPGCYPTSVILGLAPLVKAGLIATNSIIADSKSGVSGAGRSGEISLLFSEIEGDLKAYKIASHRHQPEMEEQLSQLGQDEVKITFVPHLIPMSRGILSTIYAPLKKQKDKNALLGIYEKFYQGESFVRLLPPGKLPQTKNVKGTNYCEIGIALDEANGLVIVVSAIDNLVKGASGQAVQNMNLMYGWEEKEGLASPAILP